jgi:hypothetical protein
MHRLAGANRAGVVEQPRLVGGERPLAVQRGAVADQAFDGVFPRQEAAYRAAFRRVFT